jgi:L-aspartate oxidase
VATSFDFLIVGSGIAGLRAAIALAPLGRVLVLTKTVATESNTGYAQGGIAAAIGPDDTPDLHGRDTIRAGDGLCDEEAVSVLVSDGPRYVRELIEWGVRFDREADGAPALALEAVHSVRRVLHAGDATGREIGRALWERTSRLPSVTTVNHALVTELIAEDAAVRGVRYFDDDGAAHEVRAHATLLATGGAGQVFRESTNPGIATGDGVALAYYTGARVADLEFVQFHPTALQVPGAPRFLISEAIRGEGARLVNAAGEAFMRRYHELGDLAPRDVVARSIVREADATRGPVALSLAHLDPARVRERFPTIAAVCREAGLDLTSDPIPVGPAAHYVMGGIDTDVDGRTSLAGLYAAGEAACTGVHGANRLASNSLLEGLVFGARAAAAMTGPPSAAPLKGNRRMARRWPDSTSTAASRILTAHEIRALMWRDAGLFRNAEGLAAAVQQLDASYERGLAIAHAGSPGASFWRDFNLAIVARLIARAAFGREESRGGHYREDFPSRDDLHWKVHLVDERSPYGQ